MHASQDAVLELDGIAVDLGTRTILDGVRVRFGGGSLGLLGPNGAGKTTLIRAILGLVPARAGSGRVLGHDVAREPLEIRQKIGYMPESDCHIPGMNGVRFVAYAGALAGMRAKDALERAHQVLFYVGLGEVRYRALETYSSGMKQRAKLAQALVHDPQLVFLDEPTNGLDPRGRVEMLELVRDISRSKGIHVVLSTHLLPDVESVCTEAVVLHRGRLVASGPIADLKRRDGALFACRIRGDAAERDRFAAALAAAGCDASLREDGDLAVRLPAGGTTRAIVSAAHAQGVQIRRLVRLQPSLEEVFLQAIEGGGA